MTYSRSTSAFPATHWSSILTAREVETPEGRDALTELCQVYWYPVYGLMRRWGYPSSDAADLTQDYFARLMQGELLRAADRDRGRFRSFLRTDCRFFLSDQRDRHRARKRGGGTAWLSIDAEEAETRLGLESSDEMSPDRLFDRAWGLALLDRTFDLLARSEAEAGRGPAFDQLKAFLTAGSRSSSYATVANSLGMTVTAVQSSVGRLRRRYRALLRAEVASTLADPGESNIDEEIRSLFSALA